MNYDSITLIFIFHLILNFFYLFFITNFTILENGCIFCECTSSVQYETAIRGELDDRSCMLVLSRADSLRPPAAKGNTSRNERTVVPFSFQCNSCQKPLIYPHQRLNFYSDYSRVFGCPHCRAVDAHFVKPLSACFTREQFQLYSQWP